MRWTFLTLNAAVEAEVKALPADMQARFLRFGDIIGQAGLEACRATPSVIWTASSGNCG